MNVPFNNLPLHHEPVRAEIEAIFREVLAGGQFAGGPNVEAFEAAFAAFCGSRHAVGVGSGTDALWLALAGLGIGPGDEVITVPMTFFATAEAISRCGARPVFVDIEEATYTMDVEALERAISPRTKAILPVHLFGQTADMAPILELAGTRGIPVVEDAAQAHGARYHGRHAGSMGRAGCFSFYPGKNLGALGEAGAVITDDAELAARIGALRNHGQTATYQHDHLGWNSRMDGLQGGILELKLRDLERHNARRREIAARYAAGLCGCESMILPVERAGRLHAWHLYPVRVPMRDRFVARLRSLGVATGIHYPVPVHLQAPYAPLGHGPGSFPVSERCASEFVSLPLFPEMTDAQVERVIECSLDALRPGAAA